MRLTLILSIALALCAGIASADDELIYVYLTADGYDAQLDELCVMLNDTTLSSDAHGLVVGDARRFLVAELDGVELPLTEIARRLCRFADRGHHDKFSGTHWSYWEDRVIPAWCEVRPSGCSRRDLNGAVEHFRRYGLWRECAQTQMAIVQDHLTRPTGPYLLSNADTGRLLTPCEAALASGPDSDAARALYFALWEEPRDGRLSLPLIAERYDEIVLRGTLDHFQANGSSWHDVLDAQEWSTGDLNGAARVLYHAGRYEEASTTLALYIQRHDLRGVHPR